MFPKIEPGSPNHRRSIDEIFLLCRLCGAGGGESFILPIFQSVVDVNTTDVELSQKIKECLHIEVAIDDKMPPLICELCIDKINDFYSFQLLCKETNNQTRVKLGLPPENYSQSPILESALTVTLLLCDHDSSDSEPMVPRNTRTPNKTKPRPKSKQVDKKTGQHSTPPLPNDTEPANKDSRPLQEQRGNKNVKTRMLITRARRTLKPLTKKRISVIKEAPTAIVEEIDVPLELPQTNTEHNTVKTTKKKRACVYKSKTKQRTDIESDPDTESIATLRKDSINTNTSPEDKVVAAKNNNSDKIFYCDLCNYSTNNKGHLKTHLRLHSVEKSYICYSCNYRCTNKFSFEIHMRTHTGIKPYKCKVCDYRCFTNCNLLRHTRTHSGEKPHKCDICEYRCSNRSYLKIHKRCHVRGKP